MSTSCIEMCTKEEPSRIYSVKAEIIKNVKITIIKDNGMRKVVLVKQNDIIDLRYVDSEKCEQIMIRGRIVDLNQNFIELDFSEEFVSKSDKITISTIRDIAIVRDGDIQPL